MNTLPANVLRWYVAENQHIKVRIAHFKEDVIWFIEAGRWMCEYKTQRLNSAWCWWCQTRIILFKCIFIQLLVGELSSVILAADDYGPRFLGQIINNHIRGDLMHPRSVFACCRSWLIWQGFADGDGCYPYVVFIACVTKVIATTKLS